MTVDSSAHCVRLWATLVAVSVTSRQVWSFRPRRQRRCKVKHLCLIKLQTPMRYTSLMRVHLNQMYVNNDCQIPRHFCYVLWILFIFLSANCLIWFIWSGTIRMMSSLTACHIQCQKATPKTKCYQPCSDGKVVANKCSLVAPSLNGNLYQWFKGIFIGSYTSLHFIYIYLINCKVKFLFNFVH